MPIEIRRTRVLSEEDRKALFGRDGNAFSGREPGLEFQEGDLHLVAQEDGKPVGHLSVFKHKVNAGGKRVCIGGVSGLVTVGKGQRRGYARTLMEEAQRILCDEMGVSFGMLFCPPQLVGFCERLGWRTLEEKVYVDQPSGKRETPLVTMIWPCRRPDWPPGEVDVGRRPW